MRPVSQYQYPVPQQQYAPQMSPLPTMHPSYPSSAYVSVPPILPFPPPQAPLAHAKVSNWIRDTPLPTALAFAPPSDSGDHEPPNKRSSAFLPGRTAPLELLTKTEEEKVRERKVERKAKKNGTGGWVRPVGHGDATTMFFNHKKVGEGEEVVVEKVRPKNAMSRKEALALAARAEVESSESSDEEVEEVSSEEEEVSIDAESESSSEVREASNTIESDSEEDESAMDRIREKMRQLAQERLSQRGGETSSSEDEEVDDSAKEFLFTRPGRSKTNTSASVSGNQQNPSDHEDSTTARDLLSDHDSDSDYENPNIHKYFNSLAIEPPQNDFDDEDEISLAKLAKPVPVPEESDTPSITPATQKQMTENAVRVHIYTDLVPLVQQPKTNPSGAFYAIQQILPEIHKLESYPKDQQSLQELCTLVLERISTKSSMKNPVIAEAQVALANLYAQGVPGLDYEASGGVFVPNLSRAFLMYEHAAKRGNVDAVFSMALCHEKGCGTSVNFKRAVHNYKKAALRNHPGAMFRLGTALHTGDALGLPQNSRDAIRWLRLSCKYATKTYPHALYEYAMMHEVGVDNLLYQDHEFMVQLLERGAELDHAGCQVKLGEVFGEGLYGYRKDVGRSLFYYSMAAELGNPEGMFELGGIYLTGAHDPETDTHLNKSVQEAVRWVSLAAESNLPQALFAMGYFAEMGMSVNGKVKPDELVALAWYKKSAIAGEPKAIRKLEELGMEVDWKALKKQEKKKAAAGDGGKSALQLGGGVAVDGKSKGRVNAGMDILASKIKGRHHKVDEELDGGHKCVVM
ncbi:hypothetical protein HDU98_006004 [Podochytrium sp. JEL0797]|nr:hypothetical protein HDU98_006004 [Podochytrium sp. JEL0797]